MGTDQASPVPLVRDWSRTTEDTSRRRFS